MTDQPNIAAADPHSLLAATRDVTQRVRVAERGGWFPLLVFAVVTFAAIPFSRYGPHPVHCSSTRGVVSACIVQPELALWYWPLALLVAYAAIGGSYLRRTRRRGVGTRVWSFVAVGGVLVVLVAVWAFWADAHPAFLAAALHLPSSQTTTFFYRVASPAGAIGLALLLLARIERSWAMLVVTVAYLIVVVTTVGVGRFSQPSPWAFLPHLLLDGGVLLSAGIVLFVAQHEHGSSQQ